MLTPDWINGAFEFCGAFFTWSNFVVYCRERELKGVYWPATAFFTVWGLWNLFYYPAIGQPVSFVGGIFLTGGSAAWLTYVLIDKAVARMDTSIDEWSSPNSSCHACRVDIRHRGFCDFLGEDTPYF